MTGFSTQWFVDGALHSLQTPSHIMVLLALALFMGQQQRTHFARDLILLALSVIGGILTSQLFTLGLNNELILLIFALSVGLLTILKLELPFTILVPVVIAGGFLLGLDSSPVIIPGIRSTSIYSWLSGAIVGIVASIGVFSLIGFILHKLLEGMVLRVMGSWIAASALFVLTLLLTKH